MFKTKIETYRSVHCRDLVIKCLKVHLERTTQDRLQVVILQVIQVITMPSCHISNVVGLAPPATTIRAINQNRSTEYKQHNTTQHNATQQHVMLTNLFHLLT